MAIKGDSGAYSDLQAVRRQGSEGPWQIIGEKF